MGKGADEQTKGLNIFEKYLTMWVGLCIFGGIVLGKLVPSIAKFIAGLQVGATSIPIAVGLILISDLHEDGRKAYKHKPDNDKLLKRIEKSLAKYTKSMRKVRSKYNMMFICMK